MQQNEHRLIVVADGGRARFFSVESEKLSGGALNLIEQEVLVNLIHCRGEDAEGRIRAELDSEWRAGPVDPVGERRVQQEIGFDRSFAQQIEQRVIERAGDWTAGLILLVAEPGLLGFLREILRGSLKAGVELKGLARDYTHLAPAGLRDQLAANGIIPGREIARER